MGCDRSADGRVPRAAAPVNEVGSVYDYDAHVNKQDKLILQLSPRYDVEKITALKRGIDHNGDAVVHAFEGSNQGWVEALVLRRQVAFYRGRVVHIVVRIFAVNETNHGNVGSSKPGLSFKHLPVITSKRRKLSYVFLYAYALDLTLFTARGSITYGFVLAARYVVSQSLRDGSSRSSRLVLRCSFLNAHDLDDTLRVIIVVLSQLSHHIVKTFHRSWLVTTVRLRIQTAAVVILSIT